MFASLLVFESRFEGVWWKSRIPWVSIQLEFRNSATRGEMTRLLVRGFSPRGTYSLHPAEQEKSHSSKVVVSAGIAHMGVSTGMSDVWPNTSSATTTNYTRIKEMTDCDAYGHPIGVKWLLEENPASQTGVPTLLRTAVCLERQEDVRFEGEVRIEYEIDRKIWKEQFFGVKNRNDPIPYNPAKPPFNKIPSDFDLGRLGAVPLEALTMPRFTRGWAVQ